MPIFKTKNKDFFKKWSPEMAYVLGFFAADGNLTINLRGSCYLEFTSRDKSIIEKIRMLLGSNHKMAQRMSNVNRSVIYYRLQIGSKEMFNDILKLGMTLNKNKRLKFPRIPNKYLSSFIRGYFDGDGNVTISTYKRKTRGNRLSTTLHSGFICGNKKPLKSLKNILKEFAHILGGTLYYSNRGYRLFFYVNDSKKLYNFMYKDAGSDLFLNRKRKIFKKYFRVI